MAAGVSLNIVYHESCSLEESDFPWLQDLAPGDFESLLRTRWQAGGVHGSWSHSPREQLAICIWANSVRRLEGMLGVVSPSTKASPLFIPDILLLENRPLQLIFYFAV
jgi:hypothetical protein